DASSRSVPAGRVPFQVHQLVGEIRDGGGLQRQIGDWVVAERLFIGRGEPVARLGCEIEVPVWSKDRDRFILGEITTTGKGKAARHVTKTRVAIDSGYESSPVLADFWGRKEGGTFEDGNIEVLLLTAVGNLTIHNSLLDTEADFPAGAERIHRHEAWRDRLH